MENWISHFKNPPRSYYPCIMWFWNDEINETEIEYQMLKFKDQSIFEFFIHPMFGFEEEYLGKKFFRLIGRCIEIAQREDMKFWIYDEYNWPSGTAGGQVLRDFPNYKCASLVHLRLDVSRDVPFEHKITEFEFDELLSATLVIKSGSKETALDLNGIVSVTENGCLLYPRPVADGELVLTFKQTIRHITETAKWSKYSRYEEGYPDLTNPAIVKDFIYHTHERYKKHFGEHFGKTIKGVFTDEPAISLMRDSSFGAMPWSESFYGRFQERYGYDIIPKLYLLERNTEEPEVLSVKRDYWDFYCRLFEQNYIAALKKWCSENNLLLTGHYVGEEYLLLNQFLFGGGFYEGLRHFDYPGIDTIFTNYYINNDRFNAAGSMIGSLAHFAGKSRVLCETFSASGWEMKVSDMLRIINRLMLFGVNYFMYMGAYYTLKGWRKVPTGCYPPSHSWHNPLFSYYNILNRYIAALSVLSANTVQTGRTLIIHPSTTAALTSEARYDYNWAFSISYNDRGTYTREDASFTGAINAHMELKRSFETGFESALLTAYVKDGKLIVAGSEYSTVLLPASRYLKGNTLSLLKVFTEEGGKIIYLNDIPRASADNLSPVDYINAGEGDYRAIEELRSRTKDCFTEIRRIDDNQVLILSNETGYDRLGKLADALESCYSDFGQSEDIIFSGEKVFVSFRKNSFGTFHTVINDENKAKKVNVRLKYAKRILLLNPADSTVRADLRTDEFSFDIKGYGCAVVFVGNDDAGAGELYSALSVKQPNKFPERLLCEDITSELKFRIHNKNYLRLEYEMLRKDKAAEKDYEALYKTDPKLFYETIAAMDKSCFADATDSGAITYGDAASNQKVYPLLTPGDRYIARIRFTADAVPRDLTLVIEKLNNEKIFVNGQEPRYKRMRLWDKDNFISIISSMCTPGVNTVVITGKAPYWRCPHTPPFLALAGNFSLSRDMSILEYKPAQAGEPINKNGFRYYFGDYSYEKALVIERLDGIRRFMRITSEDSVDVYVNEHYITTLFSEPKMIEITDYIRRGKNKIRLTVKAGLKGLFEEETDTGIMSVELLSERADMPEKKTPYIGYLGL